MDFVQVAAWVAWAWSNCGESRRISLSRFHTTESAVNFEPSWNVTFGRRRKVQATRRSGSAPQLSARPGRKVAATSERDRSQLIKAS